MFEVPSHQLWVFQFCCYIFYYMSNIDINISICFINSCQKDHLWRFFAPFSPIVYHLSICIWSHLSRTLSVNILRLCLGMMYTLEKDYLWMDVFQKSLKITLIFWGFYFYIFPWLLFFCFPILLCSLDWIRIPYKAQNALSLPIFNFSFLSIDWRQSSALRASSMKFCKPLNTS